jgi:hypothetical protein
MPGDSRARLAQLEREKIEGFFISPAIEQVHFQSKSGGAFY